MPHIVLHLSGEFDRVLMHNAVHIIQDLTVDILHKERTVIAVTVQFIPCGQWFIGEKNLRESASSAFHLDISITDETNTKAEKAKYVYEVYKALSELRPHPTEISYVHLIDARAAAYGYGGRTQEWRHQQH